MGVFSGFRNFDPAASYVSAYQTGLQNYEVLRAIGEQRRQQAQQAALVQGMAEQLAAQNPGYADYYNLLAANPKAPLSAAYLQQIFAAEKGGTRRSGGSSKSTAPPIRPNWSAGLDPVTGREYVGNPRLGTARPTAGTSPNSSEEARVAAEQARRAQQQTEISPFIKAPITPQPESFAPITQPQVIPGGLGQTRTDANGITRTVVRQAEPLSISESLRLGSNDLKGLFLPTPRADQPLAPVAAPPVQVVAPQYQNPFAVVGRGIGNYFGQFFLPTPRADLAPAPFVPPVDTGLAP